MPYPSKFMLEARSCEAHEGVFENGLSASNCSKRGTYETVAYGKRSTDLVSNYSMRGTCKTENQSHQQQKKVSNYSKRGTCET